MCLAALLFLPLAAGAQYQTRSWLTWRTVQSGRFTLHFPRELEPWARAVASKLPGIDTTVSRVTGYRPTQRVDVLIDDPFRIPNGSAWPLIDEPRMVLWATPPSPREDIGTYVSWADMLATHEFAHLAHLLRPTRNRFQSLLWKLAPVELGPISRKAPRWLIEGYATYVEGVVTGSGRPHGAWRPTILRQWALEGVLPTYGQLDATGGMYGGEFAYLAGSSFIEWLAARRGDSSLVALWRRMSARRDRGFADAFTGVYGEGPDILYGRFASELTAAARQRDGEMRRVGADTGETIQHLARETGDPAISRDGGRAAIMLASATRPGRVVIWKTIPEPDSAAARGARALLARDPEDVAPYRPFPGPKRALATLHAVGNQSYQDPRFFTDGRVLVWRNKPNGDGSWSPDLFIWDPQRESVRRVTIRANVRQGDPSPDGKSIAATRCAGGKCDLVLVDAGSGAVTLLAEGSDTRSFHRPRYSPDGRRIAVAIHAGGFWRAGLVDVATREARIITTDARSYFDLAFADDSTLVATADENGVMNVVRLRDDGRVLGRVTSVSGAAVAPEVNPADGSVWFLALHARGWDVRATVPARAAVALAEPRGETPRELPASDVGPSTRYRPDRKWIYFPTGGVVRDGAGIGAGVVNTDPVGKTELMLQGLKSLSPRSFHAPLEGLVASLTIRDVGASALSAFTLRQDGPFEYVMNGAAFIAERARRFDRSSARLATGASWTQMKTPLVASGSGQPRWLVFAEGGLTGTKYSEGKRTTAQLTVHGAIGRRDEARIGRTIATAGISSTIVPFAFTAQLGSTARNSPEPFVIGGNPPTLAPPGLLSHFIAQPALPPFFIGRNLEAYRLSIPFAGARLYAWAGHAFDQRPAPEFEKVLGAEWSGSIAAIPVLGTPTARATVGVGRWMNRRDLLRLDPGDPRGFVAPGGNVQFYFTTQFGDWAR